MTLGLVNGYMGLLMPRSLVRMRLGTDPVEGRGLGPLNKYAASPATWRCWSRWCLDRMVCAAYHSSGERGTASDRCTLRRGSVGADDAISRRPHNLRHGRGALRESRNGSIKSNGSSDYQGEATVRKDFIMTNWEFLETPVFQPAALDATHDPWPPKSSSVVLLDTP